MHIMDVIGDCMIARMVDILIVWIGAVTNNEILHKRRHSSYDHDRLYSALNAFSDFRLRF